MSAMFTSPWFSRRPAIATHQRSRSRQNRRRETHRMRFFEVLEPRQLLSASPSFEDLELVRHDYLFEGIGPVQIRTADLGGDQALDLVLSGRDGLWLARGTGDGAFGNLESVEYQLSPGYNTGVDMGPALVRDINGDGAVDLLATHGSSFGSMHYVRWQLTELDGTWGPVRTSPIGESAYTSQFVDLNNDGDFDIVTATRSYSTGFFQGFSVFIAGRPGRLNHAPEIDSVDDGSVNEGEELAIHIPARDLDGGALTFSLADAPEGAHIDARTGVFTWTPSEQQGPSSYPITVQVVDDGRPGMSDTETFNVTVREVNQPPTLVRIENQQIATGDTLTLETTASDPDLPANRLLFGYGEQR